MSDAFVVFRKVDFPMEYHIDDDRWALVENNLSFNMEEAQQIPCVMFTHNRERAEDLARICAKKWPQYGWCVAETFAMYRVPASEPTVFDVSDRGILPRI